jgi:transcription elongation GreA/GreB family factor
MYIFTREGIEELEELIKKTKERLKEIIQLKAEAHSEQDGWHDEGFQMFQREEMMLNKRLSELQNLRCNAQIIEPEEQNEVVKIGNGVVIEYEDGKTLEFILDGYVIIPSKNRVSIYSPLGKILQGAGKGEERILLIGKTKRVVKVKEIYPPPLAKTIFSKE